MDKLTCYGDPSEVQFAKEYIIRIYKRLEEYEDLDLTPDEIRNALFKQTEKRFSTRKDKRCYEEAIELAFKSGIEVGKQLGRG